MATPKFDKLCIGFVKRIPTTFKTPFAAGNLMPDTYVLPASEVQRYVNEGMKKLFNAKWNESLQYAKGRPGKAVKYLIATFPELTRLTSTLSGVSYLIADPYLDIFRIVAGIGKDNQFIRVWNESKFAIAISEEYPEYTATNTNPALVQINNTVSIFPSSLASFEFKLQYIAMPINPDTGGELVQNGTHDSLFMPHWDDAIIRAALEIYLEESAETM